MAVSFGHKLNAGGVFLRHPRMALVCSVMLSAALGAITASCRAGRWLEPQSKPHFLTGFGPTCGHEDITRFGIERANAALTAAGRRAIYAPVDYGDAGFTTSHPVVKGVYRTDFPDDALRTFHGVKDGDWHGDGRLQAVHSLRNRNPSGEPSSAYAACMDSRKIMIAASAEARRRWSEGDRNGAMFWLGHASHVVQDSFSRAHSRRGGHGHKRLSDVCTYGKEYSGVCYHPTVALDDRVWGGSWKCEIVPWERDWECLKPEAKSAAEATASYFAAMGLVFEDTSADIEAALSGFFDGDISMAGQGYFQCGSLDGAPPQNVRLPDFGEDELTRDMALDASSKEEAAVAVSTKEILVRIRTCCEPDVGID